LIALVIWLFDKRIENVEKKMHPVTASVNTSITAIFNSFIKIIPGPSIEELYSNLSIHACPICDIG